MSGSDDDRLLIFEDAAVVFRSILDCYLFNISLCAYQAAERKGLRIIVQPDANLLLPVSLDLPWLPVYLPSQEADCFPSIKPV